MLKEFGDLNATLCANSSIVREERDGRLFFTVDGFLFDSFWYSTDNYRFGTSERPSRVGATLRTPSATVARYELLRLLGGYKRWSHGWQSIGASSRPEFSPSKLDDKPRTTARRADPVNAQLPRSRVHLVRRATRVQARTSHAVSL